jgi:hypothetical protein
MAPVAQIPGVAPRGAIMRAPARIAAPMNRAKGGNESRRFAALFCSCRSFFWFGVASDIQFDDELVNK